MAWVQIGTRKINTARLCYMEQVADNLKLHFEGTWEGNPLELGAAEAAALWKHLKGDNVLAVRDVGSTMVVPKRVNAPMPIMAEAGVPRASEDRAAAAPIPAGSSSSSGHRSSGHGHSSSSSSSSPQRPPQHAPRPAEHRKA